MSINKVFLGRSHAQSLLTPCLGPLLRHTAEAGGCDRGPMAHSRDPLKCNLDSRWLYSWLIHECFMTQKEPEQNLWKATHNLYWSCKVFPHSVPMWFVWAEPSSRAGIMTKPCQSQFSNHSSLKATQCFPMSINHRTFVETIGNRNFFFWDDFVVVVVVVVV